VNFSRKDIPALLALTFVPLWVAWPCLVGHTYAWGDLLQQFEPWKELGRQAAEQGRLPLWNPTVFCGSPLLANFQSGLLYPGGIFFYLLSFPKALGLHLLTHYFLAGAGVYVLARVFGLGRGPALLAGLSFQGNPFLLVRLQMLSALSAISWTPWVLAAAASSSWMLAVLCLSFQFLVGYPPEYFFVALELGLLWLFFPGKTARAAGLLGVGCLAAVLASPLLLPGIQFIRHSGRLAGMYQGVQGISLGDLSRWFLSEKLIAPSGYDPMYWLKAFYPGWAAWLMLPLAFLGVEAGLRAGRRWALGAFLLGLFFSLDLARLIWPALALNRHPTLAFGLCASGVSLLAAYGLENLTRRFSIPLLPALLALFAVGDQVAMGWIRPEVLDPGVFAPAQSALALKPRLGRYRFLVSPAVQNEKGASGPTLTLAYREHEEWLKANTSAPSGLQDANGYDPVSPGNVVTWLNKAAFPEFGKDQTALDLLGVQAVVEWDPDHPRKIRISKRQADPLRCAFSEDIPGARPAPREVPFVELPEKVVAALPVTHAAGTLLLSDTYYPGWKARVDGIRAEIHPFAGAFRAVQVPANAQRVVFTYRPMLFYGSLAVALVALVFLCLVGLVRPA
jgi:hypothetical protein